MSRQFKYRLLMSSFGIVILILCITYSFSTFFKPFFIVLNAGLICFALKEYYDLALLKKFKPLTALGIICSMTYVFALGLGFYTQRLEALPSLILLISLLLIFLMFFNQQTPPLGNLAVTVFGIIYLVIPLSCALRINYFFPPDVLQDGRVWLAYVLIVSKITDIGAYFCGKIFGKTQLAPFISPKKTIEGALGGVGAALLTSLLFSLVIYSPSFTITIGQSLWVGLFLSILAQLGDLAESLLKRDAGVKDSSHLPGLGGVLDVVDSLVFTLPLMYLLLQMHVVG